MKAFKESENFHQEQSAEKNTAIPHTIAPCDLTRNGVLLRLLIMALLLAGAINSIWWSSGGDAITYLGVARSLWQDGQLALLGQREIFNQIGITFFYAPAFAFGDRPFLVLSIMQWFVAVGAMVGCYHWLRKILSRDDSILITGLMFLNMCFWLYYLRFLTETFCCCLLFGMALVYQQVVKAVREQKLSKAWLWVLGSLPFLIWMVLTRHVSSMLALGMAVALFRLAWQMRSRKIWVHCLLLMVLVNAVAGSTAVGWLLYQKSLVNPDSSANNSYLEYVKKDFQGQGHSLLKISVDNSHRLLTKVGRVLVPGMFRTYAEVGDWLNPLMLLNVVLGGLLVWGYVLLARSSCDAYVWMLPFYMALIWVMPYGAGTRFMIPVLPVVLLSLQRLLVGKAWKKKLLIILLILHIAVTIGRISSEYPQELARARDWPVMDEMALRINEIDTKTRWACVGMDSDWVNMLSLAANRLFWEWDNIQDKKPSYIVVDVKTQAPEGYHLIGEVTGYHLMKQQN